jgi:hypothetical protein
MPTVITEAVAVGAMPGAVRVRKLSTSEDEYPTALVAAIL